jgi:hypothetical protein
MWIVLVRLSLAGTGMERQMVKLIKPWAPIATKETT